MFGATIFLLSVLGSVFLLPPLILASPMEVVINEIAWMGTAASASDEWVELYNPSPYSVALDGWLLEAEDGSPKILLKGAIPAGGFFLLERTNDSAAPEVSADIIYKGALSNAGENLALYNKDGILIDYVPAANGWFVGDNNRKQTMERKTGAAPGNQPSNWQTSLNPGGTPKTRNSSGAIINEIQSRKTTKPVTTKPVKEPLQKIHDRRNSVIAQKIAKTAQTAHQTAQAAVSDAIEPSRLGRFLPVLLTGLAVAALTSYFALRWKWLRKNRV